MKRLAPLIAVAAILAGCSGGTATEPSTSASNSKPPDAAAGGQNYGGLKFPATAGGFVLDKCPAITNPLVTGNANSGASVTDVRYMETGVTLKPSAPPRPPQPPVPPEVQCRFADEQDVAPAIDVNVYSFPTEEAARQYAMTSHISLDQQASCAGGCARLNGTAIWMAVTLPAGQTYDNWHAPSIAELTAALNDIVDSQ